MGNRSLQQLVTMVLVISQMAPGASAAAGRVTMIDPGRADKPGFQVVIEQAGYYRLAGDLKVADANTTAIEINADNVTLDLNGHAIQGPARCQQLPAPCWPSGTGNGVHTVGHSGIAVKNGIIQGMGNYGVYLETNKASLDRVVLARNAHGGAVFFGGSISNSVAEANGGDGVFGVDLKVRSNVLRGNQMLGLAAYGNSTFSNNQFKGNNNNAAQTNLKPLAADRNVCNAAPCR
ncbi:right-handed parallel beta-helix repeat-containing protein [Collimonas silvisoli]|uniref:right-handed parallel beta-helix repeat-containing protein n=1 Tax=Collimonas silvisoli TaxID=2825884 RepID=UPI001B8CB0A7|nr:right-handed parallel beta-helix repeat-containing protein [Collimonas silvisoli]